MSELTTGAIALSLIGTPAIIAGAALVGTVYAAKWLHGKYEELEKDIQETEQRLKWLDKQRLSSPLEVAKETKLLQGLVVKNPAFEKVASSLSVGEKNQLAMVIATKNSPIKNYIPKYLEEIKTDMNMESVIFKSVDDLAISNLNFVSSVVSQAAKATGFNVNTNVIRKAKTVNDIIFTDGQGRNMTAFVKLNKELNPTLAIDLEGFNNNSNECTKKMDEIVKYLTEHGVPFQPKKLHHNNPMGILRKNFDKVSYKTGSTNKFATQKKQTDNEVADYLTENRQTSITNKTSNRQLWKQ
jgi:hypothetical protein